MAAAVDGYVVRKCAAGSAIPAHLRVALCNAAAAEAGWILPSQRPYGSAGELAKHVCPEHGPGVDVVVVCGADKLKGSGHGKGKGKGGGAFGAKNTGGGHAKVYVGRGDGADDGALPPSAAVRPGLSSTLVRTRLLARPGMRTVRVLAAEGLLSAAVVREAEARVAELQAGAPALFGGRG